MVHGPAQRLFLQVMTQRRSLDEVEAVNLMKSCCNQFGERVQELDVFVQELNLELEDVELALRHTVEEREDSDYVCLVLVNLMAGQATRVLSTLSPNELAFLRLLIGEIVASEEGELRMTTAINIGLLLRQRLKASLCEKLIERLVEEKWLLLIDYPRGEACVSLSGLIISEINTYLEETHAEDIVKCFFCTKLTFKGYRCQQCGIAVHRDCCKKYWDTSRKRNTCPGGSCDAYLGPTSPDPQSKRSRVGLTGDEEVNEDESQEQEQEEEEENATEKEEAVVTRSARGKGKGKGKLRRRRKADEE